MDQEYMIFVPEDETFGFSKGLNNIHTIIFDGITSCFEFDTSFNCSITGLVLIGLGASPFR